ncbi:MAG: DAK2 domain-containing protein [Anaerolineales bacterium]|nr:DAK2 domain-containing protein [Anaerolineales bacterium]
MDVEPHTLPQTERVIPVLKKPLDGQSLKTLIEAGLAWLRTNQQTVNALNVFPVPDGDTGTNMVLTMQAALDETAHSSEGNFGKMAHAVAHGALMGARGNSGVILSQLWRGFARAVDEVESLDAATLAHAMAVARDTAYKGVVRPVEGTILTIAKDVAQTAEEAVKTNDDLLDMLDQMVSSADASVQRTPELLPVLKEAGVVDAGGKGLFYILEGMLRYARGLPLDAAVTKVPPLASLKREALEAIEPGQDFEVVVDFRPQKELDLELFYQDLEAMGTSIQLGEGDGIYRLHIHVPNEKRYEPIEYTMTLGTITKVAMENLVAQMEEIEKNKTPALSFTPVQPGHIAAIAVAPGEGIARVFASLGVANIVRGGQTMNPSTQEILSAFENLPTDKIVILPNNKNVIRTANAAAELTVKQVAVIPSRSVPQGLSAMLRLAPHEDFATVVQEMNSALEDVVTAEITYATRSVVIDDVAVEKGQYIGLLNGKLVVSGENLADTCLKLLAKAEADNYELITLYSGMDVQKAEVNSIVDKIRAAHPKLEIEVQDGGQPHYPFIISIE